MEQAGHQTTDWSTGDGIEIGAGTASLSLYVKGHQSQQAFSTLATTAASRRTESGGTTPWRQMLNGSADHLPNGVEREWTFKDIPGNVEEPGMGLDWQDEEALHEEDMVRLERAGGDTHQDESAPRTRAHM